MNDCVNLCVDYDDRTKTYYNREFLMVSEVPIAGEGNVIKVDEVLLDPSSRPQEPLNTYIVTRFNKEAYNEALKEAQTDGMPLANVNKEDFYEQEYIAITQERESLMDIIRLNDHVLVAGKNMIVWCRDFDYQRDQYDTERRTALNLAKTRLPENPSEQEVFNAYRAAYFELYEEDFVDYLETYNAEEYWRELGNVDRDRATTFYEVWQKNKDVFDNYVKEQEALEMER